MFTLSLSLFLCHTHTHTDGRCGMLLLLVRPDIIFILRIYCPNRRYLHLGEGIFTG